MATVNPFDLLGDDGAEDPSLLIDAKQKPPAAAVQQVKPTKLPSKPLPPAPAEREARNEAGGGARGGGRGFGRGRGGDRGGYRRDAAYDDNSFSNIEAAAGRDGLGDEETGKPDERRGHGGPRGPYRGGRRGGVGNGEVGDGERPRRLYERRSGTGRGNEIKRDGAGRGNWGTKTDEIALASDEVVNDTEKSLDNEQPAGEEETEDGNKENLSIEAEEREPEDKEMTLEEYEKALEDKRKALQGLKAEERKVDAKEFESMQQLPSKKDNDDVFVKLGSEKDKRKEAHEKEEKANKAVNINEFLKPAEGERHYSPRGRGRGFRRGDGRNNAANNAEAPSIEDPGQFPVLGAK